jgi:hypothetical protein
MQTMSYIFIKWYNLHMRKCTDKQVKTPAQLNNLLSVRRLPLSDEGEEKNLHALGLALSTFQGYLVAVHIDQAENEISPQEVREVDLLLGDEEKYLPVFTSTEAIDQSPADVMENDAVLYYADPLDLHTLLGRSQADAAVLNPGLDDLILSRTLLENMIALDPKNSKAG